MSLITHVFESHKRIQHGVVVSHDYVQRRANLEYDATGNRVIISILPTLSSKSAYLVKQVGFTLYYKGDDPDYRFEVECWQIMELSNVYQFFEMIWVWRYNILVHIKIECFNYC